MARAGICVKAPWISHLEVHVHMSGHYSALVVPFVVTDPPQVSFTVPGLFCHIQVGNSWRTTQDIDDSWDGMLRCLDNTVGLSRYAQPGAWNDPDMLEASVLLCYAVLCCLCIFYAALYFVCYALAA